MKIFGFILFWTLLFCSCKEVTFKAAQPSGSNPLKEVPIALRGKYQPVEDLSDEEKKDTLIIEPWGYHFKDKDDKDWLGKGVISDSLVVKFYKDYFFVNFRIGDQWALRLIRQKITGDIEFMSIDIGEDTAGKERLQQLRKRMKVMEINRGEDTFYQISPSQSQLMALIKDGFFKTIILKKVK
jgi:hypothetical protein